MCESMGTRMCTSESLRILPEAETPHPLKSV